MSLKSGIDFFLPAPVTEDLEDLRLLMKELCDGLRPRSEDEEAWLSDYCWMIRLLFCSSELPIWVSFL